MNYKPGDFLFGIVEFLAFIVPGMIFCLTLPDILTKLPDFLNYKGKEMSSLAWITLILLSYIAGHFLHHLSALIFNPIYKWGYYRRKRKKHLEFLEATEVSIKKIIPQHKDLFRIVDAYIRCNRQNVLSEIDKAEANSKLFRALSLLSLYLCFYFYHNVWMIFALIVLSGLSFNKFAHQRWTHRLLCYEYFCILNQSNKVL
jgi:chromate transport protein ChrA